MLKNYLKIAFRNLLRHKAFSFINIFGLAIGMACSILILLWVQDELSYDRFHANADNLYRITANLTELDVHAAVTSTPIAEASQQEIPEIKKTLRLSDLKSDLLQVDDRIFEEKRIIYADSTFFEIFSFQLISGNKETALQLPDGILITEAMAQKYFGDEVALGKMIQKNHKDDLTVVGVLKNIPSNSHLQFDFIQPMAFLARTNRDLKDNIWDNFNYYTYVLLDENTTLSANSFHAIEDRIGQIYKANEPGLKVAFQLQPLTSIHLHTNLLADFPGHGNIQYVYILSAIAVIILIVACINFMNLATARSARRAKEVGLRKVSGAGRSQLIGQFLAESSLIALLAFLLAMAIVLALLPAFNELSGKTLSISVVDTKLLIGLALIAITTGIFSGSYPALFLSGFLPVNVLKGTMKSGTGSSLFRNTLVVIQFAVSIVLLVGTGVVYNQLQFIRNMNLGFDKENLIYVHMTGDLWNKYQTFRNTLEQNPYTSNYSFIGDLPVGVVNATVGVEWEGKDPNTQPLFGNIAIDDNFFDVFHVTLLAGRGFSKEFTADSMNLIVNERALQTMGMDAEAAVGKPLTLWGHKCTIIGVVKDFNFRPIQEPIEPLILRLNSWGGIAVVRAKPGQTQETIAALEKICHDLNPEYPFSFDFVDKEVTDLYKAEQRLGKLFNVFAGLGIFISCLGLYGLSAFLAERRTKEIGVRKVLGASILNVVFLLSKTFTKPVLVAMAIATPLAWYAMNRWLEGFAYHVTIHWSIFLLAFLATFLVAWLTVSYESIKAALINPTEALRNE